MTDLPAVKSDKGQESSISTTYEQALIEYESELMGRCDDTCHGCSGCFAPEPELPNPEDYLDEGEKQRC
jgi:hypothetical protein